MRGLEVTAMQTRLLAAFFVQGHPAPGGSKSAFVPTDKHGNPFRRDNGSIVVNVVDAGGKRNKEWRKAIAWVGKGEFGGDPVDLPLAVVMTFYMPRPMCDFGTGRNAHQLKPSAPEWHMQDPDSTKLQRAAEDALNEIAWVDDNRIQEITSRKLWNTDNQTHGHEWESGVWIEISEILTRRTPATETLEFDLPCPPPTTTTTPTTATTETSLGFSPTKDGDSPW